MMADNNAPRVPFWGAPAAGSPTISPESPTLQVGYPQEHSRGNINRPPFHQNPNRYQRPGPYNRGRNGSPRFQNRSEPDSTSNSPGSNPYSKQQSFSQDNPFQSKEQSFSAENPFQNKPQSFSPGNPFQGRPQGQFPSPSQQFQPRAQYQSSPVTHRPSNNNPRFSPYTPRNRSFNTPNQSYQTPSPRGFGSHHRGSPNSSRGGFTPRNRGMNNPGGSDNIRDYIQPSMLEDPWRNVPATPMLQTY